MKGLKHQITLEIIITGAGNCEINVLIVCARDHIFLIKLMRALYKTLINLYFLKKERFNEMKHYEDLIERLRNGTRLPILAALMNEAADAIEELQKELCANKGPENNQ